MHKGKENITLFHLKNKGVWFFIALQLEET